MDSHSQHHMTSRPFKALLGVEPATLILAMILLKTLAFFALLPFMQDTLSTFYGIDFADNYQLLAENLAEGNGYRFSVDTALTLMREPGYPLFLSVLFALFGFGLTAARVANLVFSFASAVMIARMAGQITGSEVAKRVAPLLFLVHPGIVVSELRGGVESLFIMLLLCFFAAVYRALRTRNLKDFLLAGMVLGITSSVRSTALLFPPFLVVYFFCFERPLPSLVTMAGRVALIVAGSVLILSPWMIRNYSLVQKIVPTASVAGVSSHAGYYICTHLKFDNNLYDVDYAAATERSEFARQQGYKFREVEGLYYLYFYDPHDEIRFNNYLGGYVVDKYQANPTLLLGCATKNAFNFWFAGKNWASTASNVVVQLPYLILGIAGLIFGMQSNRRAAVTVLLLFLLYTLGVYLPILAQARYSMHLIPILSLLSALAIGKWTGDGEGTADSLSNTVRP